mgnify:CR=1 FL=1
MIYCENLDFKVSEHDLESYFEGVRQVLLVKNARGQSRGFAFVELETPSQLMAALDMKNGHLHNRDFKISKSNREICFKKQDKGVEKE